MVDTLQLKMWESRTAFFAHVEAYADRSLIVGRYVETPVAYYSCSIDNGNIGGEIAIISSRLGGSPAAVAMDGGARVLVGHDMSLTSIDANSMALVTSLSLMGVFFEFIPVDADEEIVVVYETGVLRVDANATTKWSVECDVIEDFVVDGHGCLVLSTMDGAQLAISLQSGVVSR